MSTDKINDAFKNGINFKLLDRSPKGSGLTYELKNIFEEMAEAGIIKDKNGDGLSKKEALNMYNTLNKIHQETGRSTNYTKMRADSDFRYTAKELKMLAEAAGYEVLADTTNGIKAAPLFAPVSVDGKTDASKIKPLTQQTEKKADERQQTVDKPIENPPADPAQAGKNPKITEFGDNPSDYEGMSTEQKMAAIKKNDIKDVVGLRRNEKLPDNFEVKINNVNNEPVTAFYLDGKEIKGEELSDFINKLREDTLKAKSVNAETKDTEKPDTDKTRKEKRAERRQARKEARAQKHQATEEPYIRQRGAIFKTEGEPDRLAYTYKDFVGEATDISKMSKAKILQLHDGELVKVNNTVFIKEGDTLVSRGEKNTAYAGDVYYTTESYSINEQGKPDKLVRINNPLGDGYYEYNYDEAGTRISEIQKDNKGNILKRRDCHNGYNIVDGRYKEFLKPDGSILKYQVFNRQTATWEDMNE